MASASSPRAAPTVSGLDQLSLALLSYLSQPEVSLRRQGSGDFILRLMRDGQVVERLLQADFVGTLFGKKLIRLDGQGAVMLTKEGRALVMKRAAKGSAIALAVEAQGEEVHLVNLSESPLKWLAARGGAGGTPFLLPHHLQGGERLRADFSFAHATPSMAVNWQQPSCGYRPDGLQMSEASVAARQRVRHALEAVGPELSGILIDVCGHAKGLEKVEAERQWPARTAKIVLRLGLEALARHYGYGAAAKGRAL